MSKRPVTPMLDAAMAAGYVWTENGYEYLGRAADGVVVGIGCVLRPKDLLAIEAWLRDYPTPDKW
jgi:hypothetical protein